MFSDFYNHGFLSQIVSIEISGFGCFEYVFTPEGRSKKITYRTRITPSILFFHRYPVQLRRLENLNFENVSIEFRASQC